MKQHIWWYELKDKATELAAELDNPASVMIRRLVAEIEGLEKKNDAWQQSNWKLVEENVALKEKLKQWEEDLPDISETECTCDLYDHDEHECPFAMDVHDDKEATCSCCPKCYQDCVDSI